MPKKDPSVKTPSTVPKSEPRYERRQRRPRSVVWNYFERDPSSPLNSKCKLCGITSYNAFSNTTNLFKHLRHKHPLKYEEAMELRGGEVEIKTPTISNDNDDNDTPTPTVTVKVSCDENNDISDQEEIEIKPKFTGKVGIKRPRSVVWYYFDRDKTEPFKAKCKLCGMVCVHGTNTTNLFCHLKFKHPKIHEEARNQQGIEQELYKDLKSATADNTPKKICLDSSVTVTSSPRKRGRPPKIKSEVTALTSVVSPSPAMNSNSTPATTFHHTPAPTPRQYRDIHSTRLNANKLLVNLIAKNQLPASIVTVPGFKQFAKALDPRYDVPSKKTITYKMIPDLADDVNKKVKNQVQLAKFVVLSVEKWNYRKTEECITVMAHLVKENWEMASVVLETFNCSGTEKESSDSISQELKRIADEWAISDKVVTVVSDNDEQTILAAILSSGWEQVACYGKILEKIIIKALESVEDIAIIRKKTMEVVDYFGTNVKASDTLLSVQQHHNLPQKRLKIEVNGRWTSILKMFERMVEQFEAVNTVLCFLGQDSMCLCDDEIELTRAVIDILQPFKHAALELFKGEFSSMATVIPLSSLLSKAISNITVPDESENSTTVIPQSALKNALIEQMQLQFKDVELSYNLAVTTLLDPRFKHHGFADASSMEMAKDKLLQEMIALTSSSYDEADSATISTDSAIIPKSKDDGSVSIWNMFDKKITEAGAKSTGASEAENECNRYLKEAVVHRTADPLTWWKLNKVQFPNLQYLAKKYLAIPANATAASRLKSKEWEDIITRRDQVKPSDLYTTVFLSVNLK